MTIKALVVDDEELTAEHTCRLLSGLGVDVLGFDVNPYAALDNITLKKPDVLFLDVEMPELNGMAVAEKAQALGYEGEIVFVTAYKEYAVEAFTVNALDYLLKPMKRSELERAVERVKRRICERRALLPQAEAKTLHVTLLGPLAVLVGESKTPIRWMTAKCAETFAYLLLHGRERSISKDRLLEAIWPDKTREKGDINLRSTLSRLNKTLREAGAGVSAVSTGNGYKLIGKSTEIKADAIELEKAADGSMPLHSGNREVIHAIVAGYSNLLLEDMDSEWCHTSRSAYHSYFVSAASRLIAFYEDNAYDAALPLIIIQQLLTHDPYNDGARAKAMKLHYELMGPFHAQKYYNDYAQLLYADLGLTPGESLKQAYESLGLVQHVYKQV